MTSKAIVGIDPGLDGGVVLVDPERKPILMAMPIHLIKVKGKKTPKREYDIPAIVQFLIAQEPRHVFLEKQQAMSQPITQRCGGCGKIVGMTTPQGAVSIFSHARGYGLLEGVLAGLRIPYELVHTRTWQTEMLSGAGDTKVRARQACGRLYAGLDLRASERARNPHEGIVDALLIATYGQRALGIVAEDPILGF